MSRYRSYRTYFQTHSIVRHYVFVRYTIDVVRKCPQVSASCATGVFPPLLLTLKSFGAFSFRPRWHQFITDCVRSGQMMGVGTCNFLWRMLWLESAIVCHLPEIIPRVFPWHRGHRLAHWSNIYNICYDVCVPLESCWDNVHLLKSAIQIHLSWLDLTYTSQHSEILFFTLSQFVMRCVFRAHGGPEGERWLGMAASRTPDLLISNPDP